MSKLIKYLLFATNFLIFVSYHNNYTGLLEWSGVDLCTFGNFEQSFIIVIYVRPFKKSL